MSKRVLFFMALSCVLPLAWIQAQVREKKAFEEPAVAEVFEKMAKAFSAGDAKALALLFTEDGELDLEGDDKIEGRQAIEADYAQTFKAGAKARLEIDVDRQRRLGGEVIAVEGRARVLKPNEPIARSTFSALLVRKEGQWLIDSVREQALPSLDNQTEQLKELAWMNGTWRFAKDDLAMELESTEVANGNFRSNRFRLTYQKEVLHEGTQILGWDPVKKHIRSWVFSSDGSFGEGVLERKGDRYILRVTGVLPDGSKSSATQILTPGDRNHFTWQVTDRNVDNRVLPNVQPIQLTREEK